MLIKCNINVKYEKFRYFRNKILIFRKLINLFFYILKVKIKSNKNKENYYGTKNEKDFDSFIIFYIHC